MFMTGFLQNIDTNLPKYRPHPTPPTNFFRVGVGLGTTFLPILGGKKEIHFWCFAMD